MSLLPTNREEYKKVLLVAKEALMQDPSLIYTAWTMPLSFTTPGLSLFTFCGKDPFFNSGYDGPNEEDRITYGCLTQVKGKIDSENITTYVALTPELTEGIQADERIPSDINLIMPGGAWEDERSETLDVFVEWQLRIFDERAKLKLNQEAV